jgi:LCP family protein required for cell wall assembly
MKIEVKNVLKKAGLVFFMVLVFFATASLTYFALSVNKVFVKPEVIEVEKPRKKIDVDEKSLYNILLLGYGGAGHDGGTLSDTIIIANIDTKNKRVNLISIPRDLWVEIPVRSDLLEWYKINMAHAIGVDDTRYGLKEPQYKGESGGGELAKTVVSTVVDMPIDYFISVSFDGFKEAIDILDGIEVAVPVAFDDHFYPVKGLENETCGFSGEEIAEFHDKYSGFDLEKQFECRYEHLHFDEGRTQMSGEVALKFVRSRHSSQHGGDFARSQRQKAVIVGIKNRVVSLGFLDDALEFFNKFTDVIRTDVDTSLVESAIDIIGNPNEYSINFISLSEENVLVSSRSSGGAFILVPKEGIGKYENLRSFIKEEIALSE